MTRIRRIPRSLLPLLLIAILIIGPNGTESGTTNSAEVLGNSALVPAGQTTEEPSSVEVAPSNGDPSIAPENANPPDEVDSSVPYDFEIPVYEESPCSIVNGNVPYFNAELIARAEQGSFEEYAPLDDLGRASCAIACAGPETMPDGERGSIGHVKPSGFDLIRYDWIDGKYLYNRCHLIGWQITGENDNLSNLVTGTRYLNVEGMLPFENDIAGYIESTGNHVLYRATAIYQNNNLVSHGVLLEAVSVEDAGEGLRFCVFCFNVQPGVSIDYSTGASTADGTMQEVDLLDESQYDYILNTNTGKIHKPDCSSVDDMKENNKRGFNGTVAEAKAQGFTPCGRCNP